MVSQSEWSTTTASPLKGPQRIFFTEHEWQVVEGATARIIPTDYDPGAREANVVRFLDRFLSGTDYIYASARGDGFLEMSGKEHEAWKSRIEHRQAVYRDGIQSLDELSENDYHEGFVDLSDEQQDAILTKASGKPKPRPVVLSNDVASDSGEGGPPPSNQPVNDTGMGFFDMLVTHTRQGFYADPVYGGNAGFIGWRVIGFDGPNSLADTVDGSYTTTDYMLMSAKWPYAQSPSVQAYRINRAQPSRPIPSAE
ncbi:gluconate 2-dehydrogenase subunit 3 family protein [Glaciibacter flavus]|uniref:gluconate 2-dehydrogenase subunit 3 family protein n=1 Tax=Orlajensenia flava TaxID=2565934 RepID=UPI003B00B05B